MRLQYVAFLAALVALTRAKLTDKRQTTGQACVPQEIVFMLDSSSYIGNENYLLELQFIKNNIKHYNLNPQCTQIGIVTYGPGVYDTIYLNQYHTEAQFFSAIDALRYHDGGSSNVSAAISYVSGNYFTSAHGGRTGVPHYGIIITGSSSIYPAMSIAASQGAQKNGMIMFTVGIGGGASQGELSGIASGPKNQFTAQNFNSLSTLAEPLATRINGAATPTMTQSMGVPNSCLQKADIVFLVDGSGSIGATNFIKLENFMKGIVSKLDVGQDKVHVGLVQFSNYPSQQFALNMYTNRQDVITGIDQMHYMGGGTNTADGIKYMREHVFSTATGARSNVPRIAVVITDGKSSNTAQTTAEADKARQEHIGMLAVGVGQGVDTNELHHIADSPASSNTFEVANFDQLDNIATQIMNRACQVRTTAPPPTNASIINQPQDPCHDMISNCDSYEKSVCSGSYFGWARDNCPRFCGFCVSPYTTAPPPCVDRLTNCNEYQVDSCVGAFESWAKVNCRKYCGYCDAKEQSVGFYGHCYYKGKQYKQGETWDDGCDYQCTCMEAQTGQYQCYNKCPVYYNLPTQCTLVKSESRCCLQPVCNFDPKISVSETLNPGRTTDGSAVCNYKNHHYYQGQTWEDECQFMCTCNNAATGLYKCQTLCPDYTNVPTFCQMVTKPGECCAKPVCEFSTQQGSFTGSGTISGHGISISPTAPPACVDAKPDCNRYGPDACINFKPWARDNCRKTCNFCIEDAPNPDLTDVCIYEGKAFHQGQTWQLSCDTTCTCENAVYGYYRCVNSCPTYNNLPSTCRQIKKAGDCCTSVECQAGSGTFLSSTGNLATIGGGGLIMEPGHLTPTLPSGGTPPPGTGGTSYTAPSLKGCLYKGQVYISGQTWLDGCQFSCVCQDADQGLYECRSKCPDFPNLPSECHLEADPSDPCCQRPKCQFIGTPQQVIPSYKPSVTGHNIVQPPQPIDLYQGTQTIIYTFSGPHNNNQPTASTNVTGGIGHCEYKGKTYLQAETWEDGCDYNCVCEDSSRGFYRCKGKCARFENIPAQCHLIPDPANHCCQIPTCSFPGDVTTFVGTLILTTPSHTTQTPNPVTAAPKPKMCLYKNTEYSQGQTWYDGCDYKCTCDDASIGTYLCTRRCPEFFNVPSGCVYVRDPKDPSCCQVPQCTPTPPPGATLAPGSIGTIAPGSFVGQANTTMYVGYCKYKGQQYHENNRWQDGCDYTCTCDDESKGKYTCVDRCASYGVLPPQCRMVPDFQNPCCQKPDCNFNGNVGEITGTLAPHPDNTGGPNPHPTGAPQAQYCMYKDASYSQGQTWTDGCQYKCRCDDASRGLYVCNDRCPQYPNIPSQCKMITDPTDSCCSQPSCDFMPINGQITGTLAPNMIPTKVPAVIHGQANTPAPTPGHDGSTQAPQPLSYCEYKGSRYPQGATWDDGCDYTCRCVDATIGKYQCDEKCPKYTNIPTQCHLVKDAAQPCCFKPVCNFVSTSGEITGHLTPSPQPGHTNAPQPSQTPSPNPTSAPLPKDVCIYRADRYTQGQQWFDGCNFKCICENAQMGVYRCDKRCADYASLPAGCTMVADQEDPLCCKVPQCTPVANSSQPFPTPPPGKIIGGSVTLAPLPQNTPTPSPGGPTQAPILNSTPAPIPKSICIYKGKEYSQGQRWQDGCDYKCVCTDGMTGMYECTEICPKYPNLPPQCKMVQDYNQPCCQVPSCDFTGHTEEITGHLSTSAPIPGVSTVAPSPGSHNTPAPVPKKLCSYNGVMFKQGQRWDDGCDLQCVCENELTGYYRCNQRCAQYPNIPNGCTLATDPTDPCCLVPNCVNMPTPQPNPYSTPLPNPQNSNPTLKPGTGPDGSTSAPFHHPTPAPQMTQAPSVNPTPYMPPTLAPPVINGQGVTPTPPAGVSTVRPPIPVCVYNGKSYNQGQTWQDGCQYNCECTDAMSGQYRCTERCPVYPALPANCRMVGSLSDPCCKVPECTQPQPTPAPNPTHAPNPYGSTLVPGGPTLSPPLQSLSTVAPQSEHSNPTPGPLNTPVPSPMPKQFCIMSGTQYTQGQQWNVGCDKICVCDDASTGHYTCKQRCKAYSSIPADCTMVPDSNDPMCCEVPQCIPVPGVNGVPTPGPTDKPQIYTNAPHAVVTGTGTPATPTPGSTIAPQLGMTTPAPTPLPKVCVYKGQQYMQGQRWQDGCDYNCVCDDAMSGKYTCTARCGDYPNLPRQCQLQRDPQDYCCYVPVCDWSATTPNPFLTPSLGTTLAPIPGQSTLAPTPGHGTPAPMPRSFCIYNGVTFQQGQIINDGCSRKCRCDDASMNYYNCFDRCPNYPQVPSECVMVTDTNDACCQIPQCNIMPTPRPNMTPAPNTNPTLAPGQTLAPIPGSYPTPAPSPVPVAVPGQIISNPNPNRPPEQRGFCVYNGVKYTKNQPWADGCTYKCECIDDMTGQYKCTERCPRYPSIPTYCVMVEDPNDPCCKIPYCSNFQPTPAPNMTPAPTHGTHISPSINPNPTLAPSPGSHISPTPGVNPTPNPTPQPQPIPKDVCIMSGKAYTQGQTWYDGCKQVCVCDDGKTGHYTCNQRCSTYNNVQASCIYVPDPVDPMCCQIPDCNKPNSTVPIPVIGQHTGGPNPTPRPPATLAPLPGQQTPHSGFPTAAPQMGSTVTPNPNAPSTGAPTPPPQVCVYKGSMYTQGQTWRDGCQYDCTCDDAMNGKYTCTDVCPRYPALPIYCTMVRDPMNPCCQKPDCSTPSPQLTLTPAPIPGVSTLAPPLNPYPNPKTQFCVYNGIPLHQGEVFKDSCDKVCRCEDVMSNSVVCNERCPTYPPLNPGCSMVTDPNDACCQVPQCQPINPSTNPNTTIITGQPGTISGHTQPNPSGPITGKRDVCLYQGNTYKTGDTWDDGCTYKCVCVDGMSGNYRCTERCARYPNVPAQCSMIQDPNDKCCQKPYCQFIAPTPAPNLTPVPNLNPTFAPTPHSTLVPHQGVSTPAPNPLNTLVPQPGTIAPAMVCQYKNQLYKQDQTWYDDCNAICKCENAATGYYRCQERCAKYPNVPASCMLVPDPQDPSCCKVAYCPTPVPEPGVTPTPGYLQPNPNTPAPPMVTGIAPVPTPNPHIFPTPAPQPGVSTPAPLSKTGCFFNGHIYNKGQTWDDGCQFHCVCIDDMTGQYSCTKRCADYPQVPPQCVLVQDPKDACCKVPYCDFVNASPFPHGIPTPVPNPNMTPIPGTPSTPAPPGYCVYKGVYYKQGQTWNDGCDKKCQCDDVSTGFYSCLQRCASYDNLPASCRRVTDPTDSCCLVPDCNTFTPPPTPNPIYINPGTNPVISGTNPSQNPIYISPGSNTAITGSYPSTTPKPIIVVPTYIPAVFTGSSSNNPGGNTGTGLSGSSKMCVYKSTPYTQGQTWDDGCTYKCTCVDETRGLYRCTERCPHYVNLPSYCTYKQDPNDACCKVASCDLAQIPTPAPATMAPPITLNPGSNSPHTGTIPHLTLNPGTNPDIVGSQSPVTPTSFTGSRDQCIYKDMTQHPKGSTWQDGCDYNCVCEDPTMNSYKCTASCHVYSDIPTSCFLNKDPKNSCCKIPQCSGTLTPISGTGIQPVGPSGTNVVPIGTHSTFSGSGRPDNIPGMSSSGSRSVCVYKSTVHQQGESWDDGCDYTCTCNDGSKGLYTCSSKCPTYPSNIPSYCKMNTVPGQCCKSLSCNIPQLGNYQPSPMLIPTPAPTSAPGMTPTPSSGAAPVVIYPSGSGTAPIIGGAHSNPGGGYPIPPGSSAGSFRNQCVYKNRVYNQGEVWNDGCDYSCECKDAMTGYYECKPQCAIYTLPASCYTVKAAGQCCEQPVCLRPDGTEFNPLTNPSSQYPVYGSYQPGSGGFRPGYNPSSGYSGSTSVSGQTNRCVYKGKIYNQGQRWDDGCDYTCECTDAQHGMYSCTPLCPTYTALPSICHMVTLPGQCCKEPQCSTLTVTTMATPHPQVTMSPPITGCADALPNCNQYGQSSCHAPYEEWAKQNCKAYCGFCFQTVTNQVPTQCVDHLPNCEAYGQSACAGQYEPWARDNCRKFCNLCTSTVPPYTTHSPQPSVTCVDKLPNCNSYDKASACSGIYQQWALDNCAKFCDLCSVIGQMGSTVSGQLPDNNWMIMLKGVAGAPGDLYAIWNSTDTVNPSVAEAMYLTSQYHGHYKPDWSNYWSSFCIDRVKVAIFNNGVEKANIIFDATGSDKMNWFDPNRIISSTWTDIKYAPKNIFSLLGDPSTGREFFASSSGSNCQTNGWIMVSTMNNCPFESGSQKPSFYYAIGQTATNFSGTVTPGTGDVFAILAHPNCGLVGPTQTVNTIVATSRFCIYKNKIYNQGDVWQDGCQYNCSCEDASTGLYRCHDLCPIWNNLPSDCTLQTTAGECCSKPVCTITVINTDQNLTNTCLYGGHYYHEQETWKDGCKYKCICKDGKTGFYECTTLCLTWNLPPQCHLDPAPAGKCCEVPNCPSNILLQYPAGYIPQ